ncbi:hypothetical protein [Micromonospora sp. SL4-19]|uniref:hypothetical protein n=1 Tax=Micromonospora sp. SL4-19 TaxID=3399129 RepID=UPI003A4DFAA8
MRTRTALTTGAVLFGMLLAAAPPALADAPAKGPKPKPTRTTTPKPTPTSSPTPTPTSSPTPTTSPTPTASPTDTTTPPPTPTPMPTADRTVVLLPSLVDGLGSTARDANAQGVVVGAAKLATGYWHAVRWVDGQIEDLGTLGGPNSQAEAIDDQGRIVGTSQDAQGDSHAVAWVDGRIQDLGVKGLTSIAYDTAGDRVVGVYHVTDGFAGRRAFVRTGETQVTIDVPPGASATAVNSAGMVAGTHGWQDWNDPAPDVNQAFVWQHGVTRTLGTLGGATSVANGINDLGHVVGTSNTATGESGAFFWDGTAMCRLASSSPSPTAQAVNDSDLVVGTDGRGSRAMVWPDPSSASQLLPLPPEAVGSRAINVNDQGVIVGEADYLSPSWHPRAVVWR